MVNPFDVGESSLFVDSVENIFFLFPFDTLTEIPKNFQMIFSVYLILFEIVQVDIIDTIKWWSCSNNTRYALEKKSFLVNLMSRFETLELILKTKIKEYLEIRIYFCLNRYRRGLETCPQVKMSKSGHAIFFSFFRCVRATSMTQHRVKNTRVHFWTFSPVSVKIQNMTSFPENLQDNSLDF